MNGKEARQRADGSVLDLIKNKENIVVLMFILVLASFLAWRYYSDPGRSGINVDKFAQPLTVPIQDSLGVVKSYDSKTFRGSKGINMVGDVPLEDFYGEYFRNRDGHVVFALYVFAFENETQAPLAREELEAVLRVSYFQEARRREYGLRETCLSSGDTSSRFIQMDVSLVVLWGRGLPTSNYGDRCEFEGMASLVIERLDECLREKYC